jgi:hypothetical protein
VNNESKLPPERQAAIHQEIAKLSHAIQSGVRMEMELQLNNAATPKHLRTGVNIALVETGAIGMLLIRKGLVTEEEYYNTLLEKLREEVRDYQRRLSLATGNVVTLG